MAGNNNMNFDTLSRITHTLEGIQNNNEKINAHIAQEKTLGREIQYLQRKLQYDLNSSSNTTIMHPCNITATSSASHVQPSRNARSTTINSSVDMISGSHVNVYKNASPTISQLTDLESLSSSSYTTTQNKMESVENDCKSSASSQKDTDTLLSASKLTSNMKIKSNQANHIQVSIACCSIA